MKTGVFWRGRRPRGAS